MLTQTPKKTMTTIRVQEFPYLQRLLNEVGPTETGRLLGVSGTNFTPTNLENGIRPAIEMAAELIWKRDFEDNQPASDKTIIVKLRADRIAPVLQVLNALECEYMDLDF